MIKVEKEYLSFTELKEKWEITSDELHYLIQDATVIPAIAWNGYVRSCHWESNSENRQTLLVITQSEVKRRLQGWVYLRLPTVAGNCDYQFSYCAKDPHDKYDDFLFDTWFRLLNGHDEIDQAYLDREFIEKNAVFMMNLIDNVEIFKFGLTEPTNEVLVANKPACQNSYSTDLLNLLNLAISQFYNPRQKKDAKKDEIKEWIKIKGKELNIYVSDNVADSIFTIIKPNDHNPKVKRVDPLE